MEQVVLVEAKMSDTPGCAQAQALRPARGELARRQSLAGRLASWTPAPGSGAATFVAFSFLLGGLVLASRLRHRDRLPTVALP